MTWTTSITSLKTHGPPRMLWSLPEICDPGGRRPRAGAGSAGAAGLRACPHERCARAPAGRWTARARDTRRLTAGQRPATRRPGSGPMPAYRPINGSDTGIPAAQRRASTRRTRHPTSGRSAPAIPRPMTARYRHTRRSNGRTRVLAIRQQADAGIPAGPRGPARHTGRRQGGTRATRSRWQANHGVAAVRQQARASPERPAVR